MRQLISCEMGLMKFMSEISLLHEVQDYEIEVL